MQYDVNLTLKSVWEGIVKIDDTFDDYISDIQEREDHKQITIKDLNYHNPNYHTFDNAAGTISFPTEITVLVYGKEIKEYMKCIAFYGFQKIEKERGLIRKEKYYEEIMRAKGFRLDPITETSGNDYPILASYRAKMGADHSFDIKQKGIVAFGTGSDSSGYEAAYSSITTAFVASDVQPFMAVVRKKGKIFNVLCNSSGIKEESADFGEKKKPQITKAKDDPLTVLKLRLAKGEVTPEEYENLKKMLESD